MAALLVTDVTSNRVAVDGIAVLVALIILLFSSLQLPAGCMIHVSIEEALHSLQSCDEVASGAWQLKEDSKRAILKARRLDKLAEGFCWLCTRGRVLKESSRSSITPSSCDTSS